MPRALTQMPKNDTNATQMTIITLNPIFDWIDFPYRKKKNSNFVSFERGKDNVVRLYAEVHQRQ